VADVPLSLENLEDGAAAYLDPTALQRLRKQAGFTQRELATKWGGSLGLVRQFEQWRDPQTKRPAAKRTTWKNVRELAATLKCDASELVAGNGGRSGSPGLMTGGSQLLGAATSLVDTASEVDSVLPLGHIHSLILADRWATGAQDVNVRKNPPSLESSIDFQDYAGLLTRFTDEDRLHVKAIADLTDELEGRMWAGSPKPADSWVSERIFLMPLSTFRHRNVFESIIRLLGTHASFSDKYAVRLGVASHAGHVPSHPLGQRSVGMHLMLMAPDTFGGYRTDGHTGQKRQVLVTNQSGYPAAENYYKVVRKQSFSVTHGMTERELRAAIYQTLEAGSFERDWAHHDERPVRYFDLYDANIIAWVPWYFELNDATVRLVRREAVARLRRGLDTHVLEVGYGTGAATEAVVGWAKTANEALSLAGTEGRCVTSYSGLDAARRMHERLPVTLKENPLCNFVHGTFGPDAIIRATRARPIDVLFGTLVFHDIIGTDRARNLPAFLATARQHLSDEGVLVLGDVFMSSEEHVRAREVRTWRSGMLRMGLSESQVNNFIAFNPEMIATVDEAVLGDEARKHGFSVESVVQVTKPGVSDIPFKTLVLRCK